MQNKSVGIVLVLIVLLNIIDLGYSELQKYVIRQNEIIVKETLKIVHIGIQSKIVWTGETTDLLEKGLPRTLSYEYYALFQTRFDSIFIANHMSTRLDDVRFKEGL